MNAVLRIDAAQAAPPAAAAAAGGPVHRRDAALAYLGITHSHPEWLVARWLDRYGFDAAERWVRFNNDTPPLTLRANTLRSTREEVAAALGADGVETEPTRHAPDGLVVTAETAAIVARRTARSSSRTKRRSW